MRGNKGYSLIELVVVIALLAILSTVVGGSIASINGSEASKCASNINSLATKCKVNSMSRAKDVAIVIRFDGKNYVGDYYEGGDIVSTEILGAHRMSVSYSTGTSTGTDESEPIPIDGTNELCIAFDRSTGALKSLTAAEGVRDDGELAEDDAVYLKNIIIGVNARKIQIEFVQPTGKHAIR